MRERHGSRTRNRNGKAPNAGGCKTEPKGYSRRVGSTESAACTMDIEKLNLSSNQKLQTNKPLVLKCECLRDMCQGSMAFSRGFQVLHCDAVRPHLSSTDSDANHGR